MGALKLQTGGIVTIRERIIDEITRRGLSSVDAEELISSLNLPECPFSYRELSRQWQLVDLSAAAWLDANRPGHPARARFS